MNETIATIKNGVDVSQLMATINLVKQDPEIATFRFKAVTKWINGGHCKTQIKEFYGAKQDDASARKEALIMEGDEPAILLGEDNGPNAVEAVLHALASCLSVGIVYNASAMDIEIHSLDFKLEGELDLHAFLGLSDKVRPGYRSIDVSVCLDSDASTEKENELINYVKRTSPVLDIISNPVPVNIRLG